LRQKTTGENVIDAINSSLVIFDILLIYVDVREVCQEEGPCVEGTQNASEAGDLNSYLVICIYLWR